MRLRNRYSWLIVDGEPVYLIINERIKRATGNLIFEIPKPFHEYLAMSGIEIKPATLDEAEKHLQRKLAAWKTSLQPVTPGRQLPLIKKPSHRVGDDAIRMTPSIHPQESAPSPLR